MLQQHPSPTPKMLVLSTFLLLLVGAFSDTDLILNTLGRVRRRPEGPTVMGAWPTVVARFPVQDNWLLAALLPILQPLRSSSPFVSTHLSFCLGHLSLLGSSQLSGLTTSLPLRLPAFHFFQLPGRLQRKWTHG